MAKTDKEKNAREVMQQENMSKKTTTQPVKTTKKDMQSVAEKGVNKSMPNKKQVTAGNLEPEQIIMEGVEPPAFTEELQEEKPVKRRFGRRRVKTARILTKEELGIKEKKAAKKSKKAKIDDVLRFTVETKVGLNEEQIETRKDQGLTNIVENKNVKTYKSIFFSNIFTFFNLLCFLVSGALIAVGAFTNLVFMVIILCNIAIGIIQEIKAKKTIQKISLVSTPVAQVTRGGKVVEIPINEVVLDDIIHFSLGKQICADSIVIDGEVEVNESLLTGESVAVKKKKGDTLLSGSFVVSGKCVALVNRVGNYNYSATLAAKAKQYTKPKSELLYSLKLIIKLIAVIIVPLAILMYYNNMEQLADLPEAVKKTAGSIIGMIPAGMFLLTSLALAVGVIKLARKRTLVQDLYSIEMLARADVLCLDKTGTITDGTMKVQTVLQLESNLPNSVPEIMGSLLTALDDNNQTSRAMATYFGYSKELVQQTILPFSSSRKYSGATFRNGDTYAFGAPEFVLKTKDNHIEKIVKQYASKGFRVLLLVKCDGEIVGDKLPLKRTPVAVIVIEDHIREDAHETIKWFKENGVQIKIISGDNPITVSEVSKRVGVDKADMFISLEGLNEQQVIEAAGKYTVFGRVSPEQKLILVKTLKNKGHKVAMTGDGVNDILALKEADCSIAMASGSEAARHVSNLVLLDSNFSSMPSVVAEGRRVVNNIQKSSSLFLMKTMFTILITIMCLILKEPYPFNTNQILMLEYTVIGIPSFMLALQPNSERIKGRFLANILSKSLPGALILTFNVMAIYFFSKVFGAQDQFATMASIAITFAGLFVLFRLCKPLDVFRGVLWAAMVLMCAAMLTFVPFDFFEYVTLSTQNILLIIVLVQFSYPVYNTLVKITDKIQFNNY